MVHRALFAKNVFAVHGVNESGKAELVRPEVPRAKLLELIANLPPCLIGMEACSGAQPCTHSSVLVFSRRSRTSCGEPQRQHASREQLQTAPWVWPSHGPLKLHMPHFRHPWDQTFPAIAVLHDRVG